MVHSGTGDRTKVSMLMWNVHSLRSIKLNNDIKQKLQQLPKGKLMEANMIGINEHILITL